MKEPSVLLVDDEEPFVETLVKRLAKRDVRVDFAHSGQEALAKLAAAGPTKIDVVILDVKMPGMDGLEALARIKEEYALIEVIMLTGYGTVEDAIQGSEMGSAEYLIKPCDAPRLAEIIEKIFRDKGLPTN